MTSNKYALCLALFPVLCAAQASDPCMRQFEAEQARIEREMARQLPAKGDREAEVRWAKKLHAALALAGRNAEQCRRRSGPSPAAKAAEEDCAARARRQADELQHRYQGRTLTSSEQTARRAEEMQLNDAMQACRAARRR